MPSDIPSDADYQIARCQSEHPDIYDAHYDAIEQLNAACIVRACDINARAEPMSFTTAQKG